MIRREKNKAFTLIELLVVIAIIAMLLSIVTPALSKAKKQAVTVLCATQLKDIGHAFGMYTLEQNRKLPPSYPMPGEAANAPWLWAERIAPYYNKTGQITSFKDMNGTTYGMPSLRCPTQKYYLDLLEKNKDSYKGVGGGSAQSPATGNDIPLYLGAGMYGYNMYFSGANAGSGDESRNYRSSDKIRNCSSLPLVCDLAAEPYYNYKGAKLKPMPNPRQLAGWLMIPMDPHPSAYNYGWRGGYEEYGPSPNHEGKINYLFADGHVETKGNCWPWVDSNDYRGTNDRLNIFHPQGKNQ